MSASDKFLKLIGLGIVGSIMVLVFSFIPTAVWYTFDDRLAELTGVPELGRMAWYHIYAMTWFLTTILGTMRLKVKE